MLQHIFNVGSKGYQPIPFRLISYRITLLDER